MVIQKNSNLFILNNRHQLEVGMAFRILRLKDVIRLTGLSRSTIYAEIAKDNFPKQVKLTGARSVGWHEGSIDNWISSRELASEF